jgi:prepilin-type N-terminal cleavage/methylation domain-containing protein
VNCGLALASSPNYLLHFKSTLMNAPLKTLPRGFSILELLIGAAIISVVAGFILVKLVQGNRTTSRQSAAVDFANYLQKARLDSMRRQANDLSQMAQVKVFNRKSYSIAIDADGDGQLDIPLVMNLPAEQGVEMSGPFPKTFIFDGQGQPVDSLNHRITPDPVTISNDSGASAVRFSETGDVIVVPALKPARTK